MSYVEYPVVFSCGSESLLGILTKSEQTNNVGVLIAVGGPQYRVGSHRQFVLLARSLAAAGFSVFRFDYRGMGDSTGDLRQFDDVSDDIAAAIDAFQEACPEVGRIVLWGLCDAASASLIYWDVTQDKRVAGMVLLNPWVRSEAGLAKTQIKYYYGQRLLQAEFWKKLLTFKLGLCQSLKGLVGAWLRSRTNAAQGASTGSSDTFQRKMIRGLQAFPGHTLLILSGDDYTAKEFLEFSQADSQAMQALSAEKIERVDLAGADHTFSSPGQKLAMESATLAWLQNRLRNDGSSSHDPQ